VGPNLKSRQKAMNRGAFQSSVRINVGPNLNGIAQNAELDDVSILRED